MDAPTYVTRIEAAAALQCSVRTIDRLVQTGTLRRVKLGRLVRIPASDLTEPPHTGGASA